MEVTPHTTLAPNYNSVFLCGLDFYYNETSAVFNTQHWSPNPARFSVLDITFREPFLPGRIENCYNYQSPQSPLPHPGGKSSRAAFEQVVLMVRTGYCGCGLFHVHGMTTSTADLHAACSIFVSKVRRGVREGGKISQI